jgi:uncharacterized YigZ family protein
VTDPDAYRVLDDGPGCEVRVKGSRFLAQTWGATSEEQARIRREERVRRHHDATHHCWALRLGVPGEVLERYDDDGEPAGTAGLPILGALQRGALHDGLVVVTRYFGGTKLGTGGLVRAYGEAAAEAVAAAPWRWTWLLARLALECEYDDLGHLEAVLARHGDAVEAVQRAYDPRPAMSLKVRRSRAPALRDEIVEATAGRVSPRMSND